MLGKHPAIELLLCLFVPKCFGVLDLLKFIYILHRSEENLPRRSKPTYNGRLQAQLHTDVKENNTAKNRLINTNINTIYLPLMRLFSNINNIIASWAQ